MSSGGRKKNTEIYHIIYYLMIYFIFLKERWEQKRPDLNKDELLAAIVALCGFKLRKQSQSILLSQLYIPEPNSSQTTLFRLMHHVLVWDRLTVSGQAGFLGLIDLSSLKRIKLVSVSNRESRNEYLDKTALQWRKQLHRGCLSLRQVWISYPWNNLTIPSVYYFHFTGFHPSPLVWLYVKLSYFNT